MENSSKGSGLGMLVIAVYIALFLTTCAGIGHAFREGTQQGLLALFIPPYGFVKGLQVLFGF